jgi:hypothetical protein
LPDFNLTAVTITLMVALSGAAAVAISKGLDTAGICLVLAAVTLGVVVFLSSRWQELQ